MSPWRQLLSVVVLVTAAAAIQAAENELTGDRVPTSQGDLVIHPVRHATLVMQWNGKTIYVDPVGGAKAMVGLPAPDLVLITHGHGDHFDPATLSAIIPADSKARIVAPKAVAEKLADTPLAKTTTVVSNGEKTELEGIAVEAVPAYNIAADRQRFHPKGRDNGYVLRLGGKTIYIAGDTEATPEMRKLRGIDVAFLPMNLPYTMNIEQAAEAVREFKPKIVYPYHFRGGDGTMADLEAFKKADWSDAELRVREWYPR